MFETGIRQFRLAMGIVWGRRLDPANIVRLIDDARATLVEFGEPGDDVQSLTDGPLTDPAARQSFADNGTRRTARRLAAQSPFYARRFAAADVKADRLNAAGLAAVPVTVKADLLRQPDDFLCSGSARHLATRTTGTTGRPTEIWLSRYEMELWPALGALASVLRDDLRPTDVMQVNVSSRATISVQMDVEVCRLAGAGCSVIGLVPPDEALDSLGTGGVTQLASVPSYLAELVVAARARGLGPADFPLLRRILVGGEVLSPSLAAAAAETFGVRGVTDVFAMTEIIPVTGRTCSQRHLHPDINTGYVEYLDLETGEKATPGALATLVVTPFYPYRECMPVFRYDTRDVVRMLPDEPVTCEIAGMPGSGQVLGKADQIIRRGGEVVTPRQVIEALESLPTDPWPARFRLAHDGDRIALTVPESAIAGFGHAATVAHLAGRGLDVELGVVPDSEAVELRPLRSDLRETTFVSRPALVGA